MKYLLITVVGIKKSYLVCPCANKVVTHWVTQIFLRSKSSVNIVNVLVLFAFYDEDGSSLIRRVNGSKRQY